MIVVPPSALSADALRGIIDAYVLREGTDYGHEEHSLEAKRRAVLRQLAAGDAEITFDPETSTTDIRTTTRSTQK